MSHTYDDTSTRRPGDPRLPDHPKAILLVRLSARGDVIFSTPLIRAFRRTYPDAHLVWLAEPQTVDVVAHHPELDEVLVFPRKRWQRLFSKGRIIQAFREMRHFRAELQARQFDVAIDVQGLFRSGLAAWMSGAPQRIGLGSRELSWLFMTDVVNREIGDKRRISSEYLGLAELLGLDVGDFDLDVVISEADDATARSLIEAHGLGDGFAVMVPFTTRPQKHWVEDRWPGVIEGVQERLGLPCVLLGGPADRAAADRIAGATEGLAADLVGETTLGEAAAMVRRADLLIGVDTALTHLGSAFRLPTVVIFGSTTTYMLPPAPTTRIVYHRLPCSPCKGHPTCNGAFTCMKLIQVSELVETAGEALEVAGSRR